MKIPYRIILASTSPRRQELLGAAGHAFIVRSPDADESVRAGETPRALVRRLALAKARSLVSSLPLEDIPTLIIGADTIVVAPDGKTIFGKPRDTKDAVRMLGRIAGKTHTVFTGYCIIEVRAGKVTKEVSRVIASKVTMRTLSVSDRKKYVATGEPMDKAGSYAAQGLGMALIAGIRGSYTNVVGLPMAQLLEDLELRFSIPLFPKGRAR